MRLSCFQRTARSSSGVAPMAARASSVVAWGWARSSLTSLGRGDSGPYLCQLCDRLCGQAATAWYIPSGPSRGCVHVCCPPLSQVLVLSSPSEWWRSEPRRQDRGSVGRGLAWGQRRVRAWQGRSERGRSRRPGAFYGWRRPLTLKELLNLVQPFRHFTYPSRLHLGRQTWTDFYSSCPENWSFDLSTRAGKS